MHEDFSKNHFPFTAALLRTGEKDKKVIPGCTTIEGFLCEVSSRKIKGVYVNSFKPLWNAKTLPEEKKAALRQITDMKIAIDEYSMYLFKFGKQPEYWVWNLDASEKKKLEEKKEVFFYKKYKPDFDDDEDEYKLSGDKYPKAVMTIIHKYCTEEQNRNTTQYILCNASGLEAELKTINWSLKIKTS